MKKKSLVILSVVLVMTIIVILSYQYQSFSKSSSSFTNIVADTQVEKSKEIQDPIPVTLTAPAEKKVIEPVQISVGMIGDILLHDGLVNYPNYDFAFAKVKEPLESIDYLIANQESLPAGAAFGLSGYPTFNSPEIILDALKGVGVDMISMANNHTLDRGEKGVLAALQNVKKREFDYIGAYTSFEDEQVARIKDVKGIKLGFLAYTYGTNGIPTPKGKDYLVVRIDPERITREVKALKEKVDVVIVSMHWGTEYVLSPIPVQEELAKVVADAGGDIIFGTHPHVLEPYTTVIGHSGNNMHVFYSIGNFYSGQSKEYTDIGGIAKLIINKSSDGIISINNPSFYPTAVIINAEKKYQTVPLKEVEKSKIVSHDWVLKHMGLPSFE